MSKPSSDNVSMPMEHFHELSEAAYGRTPTASERGAIAAQSFALLASLGIAVGGVIWAGVTANNWIEERRAIREERRRQNTKPTTSPEED